MAKISSLILSVPDSEPIQYRLDDARIVVGRSPDNDIQVEESAVSSRHCEFLRDGDRYVLVDLGSTNGTRVNGKSIKNGRIALKNGDQILLGESVPAHFIQAIEASTPVKPSAKPIPASVNGPGAGAVTQVVYSLIDDETGADDEDWETAYLEINPVAAAVAKQEGALGAKT
ncbi:MAG: FHA domain-containing protein [Verrucomicrobiae bacterium]|nr:FHA domain-containing protein [Verrucomicrobiae bacterium]MCP5540760.1 FHA domain-containing protein [Akkermansiaceae bacterium]MCP5551342.1 FHA domain-containing protein [Akkermansiaceae bacterium]